MTVANVCYRLYYELTKEIPYLPLMEDYGLFVWELTNDTP